MGAGGVLALFLSIWVWVWALGSAAGRPASHWGPRLSMMSAVVLALPLVSSSALLLQRERLVTLARPDERTEPTVRREVRRLRLHGKRRRLRVARRARAG